MELNYSEDTKIDKYNLQEEFIKQSSLMYHYSEHAGELYRELSDKKLLLRVLQAEEEMKVRSGKVVLKDVEDKPIKLNNDIVKAHLEGLDSLKEAEKEVNIAKYDYDNAMAGVTGMEHKKRMLTLTVDLLRMGMFAEPTETTNQNEELNKKFNNE